MIRLQLLSAFPLLLLPTSSASPIANVTTISYQHEPKTRGTVGLLLSCTVTLFLCVWTALHLNIEPLEFSRSKLACTSRLVGKIIWGFTALVVPELVLTIALHQFLFAWRYRKVLNASLVPRDETHGRGSHASGAAEAKATGVKAEVGLKKAFYAIMGGFAVQGTKSFAITLDIDMLSNEATVEEIRHFPISEINDKSKADYLAKVLACVQACWIVLQCLGRRLNNLPITLLELHTALHVINAIVMYGFWWKKPVDVSQPSIIGHSEAWGNESVETTTFLPVKALLGCQRKVKERIAPLLVHDSKDVRSCFLAAQIDGCDFSDGILGKLERLSTPPNLFNAAAYAVKITADLLADNIKQFFDEHQSPEILGGRFGQAFGRAFRETFGEVFGTTFGEAFGEVLGGAFAYVLGARSGKVAREAFFGTFGNAFRFMTNRTSTPPDIHVSILRIGFRDGARSARALRGDVRKDAAASSALGATNSAAGSNTSFGAREVALAERILHAILPVCPKSGIKSEEGAVKYLKRAAAYADLPIAYERIERERVAAGVIDDKSPRPETRQRIYGEVFLHVRQHALDVANSAFKEDDVRAAAFKAAFHLNPCVVRCPTGDEDDRECLGVFKKLASTLSHGGRHIWNQLVWAPGIFGEGKELKWFDRHWCNAHRAVLLASAICSGAFYGGMHTLRWNDYFPSETERMLWKISTCIGAAGVVPLTTLAMIVWMKPPRLVSLLCWVLFIATGLAFVAARMFLLVESFVSLRDLPVRAYETVQWAESIPHI